jgi:putative toxin-antitoxin system antitoxin component (TIGR02293 family)
MDSTLGGALPDIAAVMDLATDVLGSRAAAERWLATPAMALDQRRPLDLLGGAEGMALVTTLLTRMDHCIYL